MTSNNNDQYDQNGPMDDDQQQDKGDYNQNPNNGDADQPEEVYQSFFGPPVNGRKEDTQALILREGFTGMYNLQVYDKHCFVRFHTKSEFEAFNKHFDNFVYEGVKMFATESKKRLIQYPPCTRICVSNFGRKRPTDRELYFKMSPYGYVKHISMKQRYAFVDFDTVEDAKAVMEALGPNSNQQDFHMSLEYCQEAPKTDFTGMVLPLTEIFKPDHEFWQKLVSTIQGRSKAYN
ncbi:hypothetical protein TVAG_197280 [Trichomonas vaginalis G3]|uniref:RRM domain-containing protein n=1 Tax=Trichomonas vaginalis (strain ATCC PRA-98 / G3) TaxID=412133 RepID=A2EPJ8_TRIV3|nr:RNA-binding domain, RBD family-containing protein [Trichomonas vaginalis G3]EAY05427.1 hypothetical protein TVAG_197280 [Trichomonas vaginalis G3]KAI5523865.1 RNA-binding domain, RBD family-containing protein [Trichomonas vaginalis G3]|eukprot:XP_001317650.1 hypothetical protein [Trichomonas vaginalis G3]